MPTSSRRELLNRFQAFVVSGGALMLLAARITDDLPRGTKDLTTEQVTNAFK